MQIGYEMSLRKSNISNTAMTSILECTISCTPKPGYRPPRYATVHVSMVKQEDSINIDLTDIGCGLD
jgi:hypothetical protein